MGNNRMHVFSVYIDDHGYEEAAFFAATRVEAMKQLDEWLATELHINIAPKLRTTPPNTETRQ